MSWSSHAQSSDDEIQVASKKVKPSSMSGDGEDLQMIEDDQSPAGASADDISFHIDFNTPDHRDLVGKTGRSVSHIDSSDSDDNEARGTQVCNVDR